MGSPESEGGRKDSETQHEVTLTTGFFLAETPVTQAQWVSAMGANPSGFAGCDECPVETVTWADAVDYCNARSVQEGLSPAYEVDGRDVSWDRSADGYRLPTEAEWEYACRAGSASALYNGGEVTATECEWDGALEEISWYCGNSSDSTHEVAQKLPNAWGLECLGMVLGLARELFRGASGRPGGAGVESL